MAEPETSSEPESGPPRRISRTAIAWIIVAVLAVAALVATLGSLERDIYSARGLVGGYLQAISAHDSSAALAFPGVQLSPAQLRRDGLDPDASRELLQDDLLPSLTGLRLVSDATLANGAHRVTMSFSLNGSATSSIFTVRPTGSIFGIFRTWSFSVSPLAEIRVTVQHGVEFSAGGHSLDTRASNPSQPFTFTTHADYLVLTPSRIRFGLKSTLLAAATVESTATDPSSTTHVSVDLQPTETYRRRVDAVVVRMLNTCAKAKVLMPAGCPFGAEIDNRVIGTPTWSITRYPQVAVVAGKSGWRMPPAAGLAHVVVSVQSLFDGSIAPQSSPEPFTASSSHIVISKAGIPELAFTIAPS